MECPRCGLAMLPSTGCEQCARISDEALARIARETLPARTSLRAQGFVCVGVALVVVVVSAVVAVFTGKLGAIFFLGAASVAGSLGAFGARRFEHAKLAHHLPSKDVIRGYEREIAERAASGVGGGAGPVAIPALRK